jgi:HEAT repeat protein
MRLHGLCLVVLCGGIGVARADEKTEKSPFEEFANSFLVSSAPYAIDFRVVPSLPAWGKKKFEGADKVREFPKELVKKLKSPGSVDYRATLNVVHHYLIFTRAIASSNGLSNLDQIARRTLGPEAGAIEKELVKALDTKDPHNRWLAACSLLALGSENQSAKTVFAKGPESEDNESQMLAYHCLGRMQLKIKGAVAVLARGLEDKRKEIRHAAANGLIELGPDAKAATPALIRFLETGADARGEYYPFAITLPIKENLALMALAAIGADAAPAVPVILRRFPHADTSDQCEMIACLKAIGHGARSGVPTIEKALTSKDRDVKLTAAFALLWFDADHKEALGVVKTALSDADVRGALKTCFEVGPNSKSVAALVAPLLDHKDEDVRIHAAWALSRIGPSAATAIPGLEKILRQEEDGQACTFRSHAAAAEALARIGKTGIPVLLRVVESNAGGTYALGAIGSLGKDAPPEAIDCLVRILETKDKVVPLTGRLAQLAETVRSNSKDERDKGEELIRKLEGDLKTQRLSHAALALGRLGNHGRRARPALEKCRGDGELGFYVESALALIDP